MNRELVKNLNGQMNFELYSSYLYLSMASHFKAQNLNGFAHWMDIQAKEEFGHAMKFYNFLHGCNEKVEFGAIAKPPAKWDSPLAVFEQVIKHEQLVTKRVNDLVSQSVTLGEHAAFAFLQWFVNEQVEEEASAVNVIQQLKLVGKAIFMLDNELAKRT
ncbi:MAG: ferritin [Victivallaceae bacterium]|nr:ferritin [Victivallaceae bacterium]